MPQTIRKKSFPDYFESLSSGIRKADIRLEDFRIGDGDTIVFEEWDPKTKEYTGRSIEKKVSFVLKFNVNDFGQEEKIKENGLFVIQLD